MHDHQQESQAADLLDLDEVMRAFGIDEWRNLGATPSARSEALSLRVEIQGQVYVLRERPEGLAEEDLTHRYAFQHYLQQAGIPVVPLRLTPQGETMVALGEDYFELQPEVEGESFSTTHPRSLAWVEAAGAMLAQIHQASRHYPGPVHRWPSQLQAGGLVQGWLNLARSKAEAHEIHAITAALSNWVDQWEAVLPAAMMSIGAGRNLPEFHIHGDYHALNLRFTQQAVSAVLDWEASRWEKRLLELAYALFYFSALEWQADHRLTRPLVKRGFDPERAGHFLRAYGSIYSPVPGEAALLIDALLLVSPILTINGPLEDLFFPQEPLEEPLIDDVMERLSWGLSLPAWLNRVRRSFPDLWR